MISSAGAALLLALFCLHMLNVHFKSLALASERGANVWCQARPDDSCTRGRVAFCFIVMNGMEYLRENLEVLKRIAEACGGVIYYLENDSTDGTKEFLSEIADAKGSNVFGESISLDGKQSTELCTSSGVYNCTRRTRRLAKLRQRVLDMVLGETRFDFQTVVMMDMDFNHLSVQGAITAIMHSQSRGTDGLFGMSYHYESGAPYDTGAVKPPSALHKIVNGKQHFVRVDSAFSGFGVYSLSAIRTRRASYDAMCKEIEHVSFNRAFKTLEVWVHFRPMYGGRHGKVSIDTT